MTEAVQQFVTAAQKYGVTNLFQPNELILKNNLLAVYNCLHNLSETVLLTSGFVTLTENRLENMGFNLFLNL
jgi:hypothetical protein